MQDEGRGISVTAALPRLPALLLSNGVDGVEPDQVSDVERPHRMSASEWPVRAGRSVDRWRLVAG